VSLHGGASLHPVVAQLSHSVDCVYYFVCKIVIIYLILAHLATLYPVRSCTRLAQSVERSAFNRVVVGSIPTSGGNYFLFTRSCGYCTINRTVTGSSTVLYLHRISISMLRLYKCGGQSLSLQNTVTFGSSTFLLLRRVLAFALTFMPTLLFHRQISLLLLHLLVLMLCVIG
jgi:hypothetical protein